MRNFDGLFRSTLDKAACAVSPGISHFRGRCVGRDRAIRPGEWGGAMQRGGGFRIAMGIALVGVWSPCQSAGRRGRLLRATR